MTPHPRAVPASRRRTRTATLPAVLALMVGGLPAHGVEPPLVTAASERVRQSDRDQRFFLAGGVASMDVAVLSLSRDGSLRPSAGSPTRNGMGFSMAITPRGDRVYVASLVNGTIVGYRLGSDGALTEIPGATVSIGAPVVGLALAADGSHMFATIGAAGTEIRSYRVTKAGLLRDTGAAPVQMAASSPTALPALTADAKHLYVEDFGTGQVTAYRVSVDYSLAQVGDPLPAGLSPAYPTISPNGRFLYIGNENSNDISAYAIGRTGKLVPLPGSPFPAGLGPHGTAISADGRYLYSPDNAGGGISAFAIARIGALEPLPGSPFPGPAPRGTVGRAVLSPDGEHMFVVDHLSPTLTSKVHTFDVADDGSVQPTGQPPVDLGVVFSDGPSAFTTPNQGPTASLAVTSARGRTARLTAAGSTDTDGRIARYIWTFGDGERVVTRTPHVRHTFSGGARTVTVRVVDDEGCSGRLYFTGVVVVCDGGSKAIARLELE